MGPAAPDADDVAQDVLVKLLTAMRNFQYDPSRSFSGWLKTVTHNALNDFWSDRRKEPGQVARHLDRRSGAARDDFEHGLESLFDRDLFEMAMRRVEKRVKPVTWNAFRLTALEGLSGQDAGRASEDARRACLRGQEPRPEAPSGRDPIMKGHEP